MKFKASYFNISTSLIKENLRRFWAIPVIGFLGYFLSGVFPILMSYSNINGIYDYINMCLTNMQPFFLAVHLALPIITAVIVFRYIQSSGSVTALHAMPFTKAQLFNSNVLSGFLLTTVPLFINGVLLLLIAKPTYDVNMFTEQQRIAYESASIIPDIAVNVFTRSSVLSWFWQSLLIIAVIYAISVFAGMVTGNAVMHLALASGFNFLLPALYFTFTIYCESYLFGFFTGGIHQKILFGMSPFTEVFMEHGGFSGPLQVYYIVLFVALIGISYFLYQKRQLEKAGDSLVFNFMIPTICYLISFFGMSLMGYYFIALSYNRDNPVNEDMYFYCGLAAGAVIAFILGRMIVLKTPRIFNRQSAKSFCVYAMIAIIFVTFITVDFTGFENRTPSNNKVKGVSSTSFDFFGYYDRYDLSLFKNNPSQENGSNYFGVRHDSGLMHYKDPKNIEAFIALHQDIIKNKAKLDPNSNETLQNNSRTDTIDLIYDTNAPFDLQRRYNLPYDMIIDNKYLKQVYESSEFKNYFSLYNLSYEKITNISLQNTYYPDDASFASLFVADSNKIDELIAAMEQDFQNRTYAESLSMVHPYCKFQLNYKYMDPTYVNHTHWDRTMNLEVLLSDENTIKWFKDNGYSKYLEYNVDMIQQIEIYKQTDSEKTTSTTAEFAVSASKDLAVDTRPKFVITDKKQIQEILNTYSSSLKNSYEYYELKIIYNTTNINNSNIVGGYITGYYDLEQAPKFISDHFK